jgi:cytochrome c oxidase subunit III
MSKSQAAYYLPEPTLWPLVGTIGLFLLLFGLGLYINEFTAGPWVMGLGFATLVSMIVGWFAKVIMESESGRYNLQVDRSFRFAMAWFIFTEVVFFACFFGALFYARYYSVPWLGGEGAKALTHSELWPSFQASWPLLHLPDAKTFTEAREAMAPWGLPAINTLLLLMSGVTVTWAHWCLQHDKRPQLIFGLTVTVILGIAFLILQGVEYGHAYHELNLKLSSGIYGSTFFMLTGFHGAHVTLGAIMLSVILIRAINGHFSPSRHFAFEAVVWYWHFVDVVWLGLFIFVYWL